MWFALWVTILVVGEGGSLAQRPQRSESSVLLRHPRRTTDHICCMCESPLFRFINSSTAVIDFLVLRVHLEPELEILSVLWNPPAVGGCTDIGPWTWSFQHISTSAWGLQQLHPNCRTIAKFYSSGLHHRCFCKTTQTWPNICHLFWGHCNTEAEKPTVESRHLWCS